MSPFYCKGADMKKSVIIFTILLSILSFSSCGIQSDKFTEVVVTTPEIEVSETIPSVFSATSELETVQSGTVTTSQGVNNCGNCAIQGEKIYYANSYDSGTLYSINTNGSDDCKLNDDLALIQMAVIGNSCQVIMRNGSSLGIAGFIIR